MAANEYFNSSTWNDRPGVDYNAPLPPLPPPSPGKASSVNIHTRHDTPVSASSPFDDHAYPTYASDAQGHHRYGSNTEYYGTAGGGHHASNSFADDIPLKAHAATTSYGEPAEHSPQQYGPVPEGGLAHDDGSGGRQRKQKKNRFFGGKGRTAWFIYIMTFIHLSVFIAEIARNATLTKSPIMIRPQFNPMIGPSTYVLINMGARFTPCMRFTDGVTDAKEPINWPCPNTTDEHPKCKLSELCGFSAVPDPDPNKPTDQRPVPNQWFRFIVPIFLHAGIIHIAINMLLQLTLGREMEKAIGPLRLALVYFSSGIFGNVLGGNYAPTGMPSVGASGSLFGVFALVLLDLLYSWRERRSPKKELAWIIFDIVICFALGLLPNLDNFAHIGGFLMGLVLGICLLHSPNVLRQRIGQTGPPYRPVDNDGSIANLKAFARKPVGFFKDRKPLWWVWWLFRAGALIAVFVSFIVLLNNFYKYRAKCSWCKYLSCLPIKNWCEQGDLTFISDTTKPSKRDLLGIFL